MSPSRLGSILVPATGLEPVLPKETDFKSVASTKFRQTGVRSIIGEFVWLCGWAGTRRLVTDEGWDRVPWDSVMRGLKLGDDCATVTSLRGVHRKALGKASLK